MTNAYKPYILACGLIIFAAPTYAMQQTGQQKATPLATALHTEQTNQRNQNHLNRKTAKKQLEQKLDRILSNPKNPLSVKERADVAWSVLKRATANESFQEYMGYTALSSALVLFGGAIGILNYNDLSYAKRENFSAELKSRKLLGKACLILKVFFTANY